MKKWNDPQLAELTLDNTKDSSCPDEGKFVSENGPATLSMVDFCCPNYTPDKGITGLVCKYYQKWGKCTYGASIVDPS